MELPRPMFNTAIEEPVNTLRVMESFYTVQGEGAFTGHAAFFIRLGGCDVGCAWCDVKDSWDVNDHPLRTVEELVAEARLHPARLVVITGGEPLMQDLTALTRALRAEGFRTHLETSGTHKLTGEWDHICFSPKKFKPPLEAIYGVAHELKVIVVNRHDLQWALAHGEKATDATGLFLQPEWDKRERVMPLIVDFVKEHPQWRISLQTHKFLGIP